MKEIALDTNYLRMTTRIVIFLFLSLTCSVCGTMYTRCNNSITDIYMHEPLFVSTCVTLLEAAVQCTNHPLCEMISKNETRCSFHTTMNRTDSCINDGMANGTVSKAHFTPCNCTLTDIWVDVGPFYLYATPETYLCSQGPEVCMSLGGIMAEFNSIDEMNFALMYVEDDAFVGGRRDNGQYYWRTTGHEIASSFWSPGQPDYNRSCVQLWHDDKGLDDVGSDRLKQILCQKRIP